MVEFNNLSEQDEKDLRIKELEYELGELQAQVKELVLSALADFVNKPPKYIKAYEDSPYKKCAEVIVEQDG